MKVTKIFEKNFLSGTTILLVLNLLASALNYVYQILIAGVVSVESFGTVNTIFSIMLVVGVPGTTITMIAARYLALCVERKAYSDARRFMKELTVKVTYLSASVIVIGLLLKNVIGSFLRIENSTILYITVVICALGYYHPLYSGGMSGLKSFLPLGIYALLIPVYKLLGLGIASTVPSEHSRLMLCLGIIIPGSVFTAIAGFIYIERRLSRNKQKECIAIEEPDKSQWMDSFLLNICLVLYMNIDILAVRHIGGAELSGIYSSVTLFGRIIYYGATSIGTVLLPMAATKSHKEAFLLLKKILILVGSLSLIGLLFLNVVKKPLISLIYGKMYLDAADYMIYVSLISLTIGLLTIMVNFFVGINYMKVPRNILSLLAIIIILTVLLSSNVSLTLFIIGISGLLSVISIYICYRQQIIKKTHAN